MLASLVYSVMGSYRYLCAAQCTDACYLVEFSVLSGVPLLFHYRFFSFKKLLPLLGQSEPDKTQHNGADVVVGVFFLLDLSLKKKFGENLSLINPNFVRSPQTHQLARLLQWAEFSISPNQFPSHLTYDTITSTVFFTQPRRTRWYTASGKT